MACSFTREVKTTRRNNPESDPPIVAGLLFAWR
jgi:hypothetical protein